MSDNQIDIEAIRARANAATFGPWGWYGNVDAKHFYLSTKHGGRQIVMGFRRFGFNGAQPEFRHRRQDGDYFLLTPASDLAIYEVAPKATHRNDVNWNVYRGDIIGFRSPDAEFIAHARQDVDDLLTVVAKLTAENEALKEQTRDAETSCSSKAA
jgi:hypothetical protein